MWYMEEGEEEEVESEMKTEMEQLMKEKEKQKTNFKWQYAQKTWKKPSHWATVLAPFASSLYQCIKPNKSTTTCWSLSHGQTMEIWTLVSHLNGVSKVIFLIHCITILELVGDPCIRTSRVFLHSKFDYVEKFIFIFLCINK